jgi:hypothetical protein
MYTSFTYKQFKSRTWMDIEEIHDASIFLFVNFDIPFRNSSPFTIWKKMLFDLLPPLPCMMNFKWTRCDKGDNQYLFLFVNFDIPFYRITMQWTRMSSAWSQKSRNYYWYLHYSLIINKNKMLNVYLHVDKDW